MSLEESPSLRSYSAVPLSPTNSAWAKMFDKIQKGGFESKVSGPWSQDPGLEDVAERIQSLTSLSDDKKLHIMAAKFEINALRATAGRSLDCSICDNIWMKVLGAMIPILIQFSQTYKNLLLEHLQFKPVLDPLVHIFGRHANVGTILSIVAILLSLVSSIMAAWKQASKVSEIGMLTGDSGAKLGRELNLFLSRAGAYKGYPDTPSGDIDAYKEFVQKVEDIQFLLQEQSMQLNQGSAPQGNTGTDPTSASPASTNADPKTEPKTDPPTANP